MKLNLSKAILAVLSVLIIAFLYFAFRLYILPQFFNKNYHSFNSGSDTVFSIENKHPNLRYVLDKNKLEEFTNVLGVSSSDLLPRFGVRINTIHVVIDDNVYEETQARDPETGTVYISSEVLRKDDDLSILIGLGDPVVIPEMNIDIDAYMNKLINMSIFNGIYFNGSKESIDTSLSRLSRAEMDITAPLEVYNLIIFREVETK